MYRWKEHSTVPEMEALWVASEGAEAAARVCTYVARQFNWELNTVEMRSPFPFLFSPEYFIVVLFLIQPMSPELCAFGLRWLSHEIIFMCRVGHRANEDSNSIKLGTWRFASDLVYIVLLFSTLLPSSKDARDFSIIRMSSDSGPFFVKMDLIREKLNSRSINW